MLVDPKGFVSNDLQTVIVNIINRGGQVVPEKIDQGMYIVGHWNVEEMVVGDEVRKRWNEEKYVSPPFPEFGVVDYPHQLLEVVDLHTIPEKVFVTFVKIERDQSNANIGGGWRWHKWGDYLGIQNPQCEYIDDEPDIECVYTFSVHELV